MVTHIVKRTSGPLAAGRAASRLGPVKLDPSDRKAIEAALSTLPSGHPARLALEQGADPVSLTRLVDEDELLRALEDAWYTAYRRRLNQEPPR